MLAEQILTRHLRADITGDHDDSVWADGVTLAREQTYVDQHFNNNLAGYVIRCLQYFSPVW